MATRRTLLAGSAALAALLPGRSLAAAPAALNAADFGVVPGAGDVTAALRSAIEAAGQAGVPVFIPAGSYAIDAIELPAHATLVGIRGATVLVRAGPGPILSISNAAGVTLRDLVLDGVGGGVSANDPGLVVCRNAADLELGGLEVANSGSNGLYLDGCGGRLDGLVIHDCADSGIFAYDSAGLTITGNRIRGCGNGGVRVWAREGREHDGTLVTGNDIAEIRTDGGGNGQNGNGINVYLANGVTVSGNHLRNCAFSAIRVNGGDDTIVVGNTCLASGEVAIFSEFGFSGSIIADNLIDGAAQGISMTNFDQEGRLATCSGNIVRNIAPRSAVNPDTTPVGIAAEADAVIANNVVDGVPGLGIGAGWGPFLRDVAITGNVVRDCTIGIGVSVAEGAGKAIVSGNRVSGSNRASIAGLAWHEMKSDDLVRDAGRFPAVTLGGNSVD